MAEVTIPAGMETPPYRAPRRVEVSGEVPLISPGDPDEKKVQERLIAHCRVFNLSEPKELAEYESIWQKVCDSAARVSESSEPKWDSDRNCFVAFVRWSELAYIAPRPK